MCLDPRLKRTLALLKATLDRVRGLFSIRGTKRIAPFSARMRLRRDTGAKNYTPGALKNAPETAREVNTDRSQLLESKLQPNLHQAGSISPGDFAISIIISVATTRSAKGCLPTAVRLDGFPLRVVKRIVGF
jgi:hypothetical protein